MLAAMRLGRDFSTPQFWMNLQATFDLASVEDDDIRSIESRAA